MELEPDDLIPNSVSLENISSLMSPKYLGKTMWNYVGVSTGDIIETAILLERNFMLSQTNAGILVSRLEILTSAFEPEISIGIIDQLLHKAFRSKRVSDCQAIMQLFLRLLKYPSFQESLPHILKSVRQVLFARIPTIEEIQEELSKKPGRAKIYYLNAVIPQVKVALRKLERAVLITGIMFLTDIGGDGQEFITNAIYELVFTEATVTLHTFTVICSIIISISEGQFKWGKAKLNPVLNDRICNQLWTFLSSIRQKNPDQLEAYSHLGRLFTRAFKPSVYWQNSDENTSKEVQDEKENGLCVREEGEKGGEPCRLEYGHFVRMHYSKIYNLSRLSQPELAGWSDGSLKKWVRKSGDDVKQEACSSVEVEDISILLQYGLTNLLPKNIIKERGTASSEEKTLLAQKEQKKNKLIQKEDPSCAK